MTYPLLLLTSLTAIFGVNAGVNGIVVRDSNTIIENNVAIQSNDSYYQFNTTFSRVYDEEDSFYVYFCADSDQSYYSTNYIADLWVNMEYLDVNVFEMSLTYTFKSMSRSWLADSLDCDNYDNIYYSITYSNSVGYSNSVVRSVTTIGQYSPERVYLSGVSDSGTIIHNVTFTMWINNVGFNGYYNQGYDYAMANDSGWTLSNYLYSIADTPIIFLRGLFGADLFGESLFAILLSLITLVIVLGLIRRFF